MCIYIYIYIHMHTYLFMYISLYFLTLLSDAYGHAHREAGGIQLEASSQEFKDVVFEDVVFEIIVVL